MKILEISNIFTKEMCDTYIQMINSKSHKVSFSNLTPYETDKFFDSNISTFILKRLNHTTKIVYNVNPLVLTGKYYPGDKSNLHMDIPFDNNVKYTLLIYLNDNFNGGETKFYDNDFKLIKTIIPEKGKGLLFDINLFHQGTIVTSGNKYWIGCQVI